MLYTMHKDRLLQKILNDVITEGRTRPLPSDHLLGITISSTGRSRSETYQTA